MTDELVLLPRPRSLHVGGIAPPAGASVVERVDTALPPQGYALRMDGDGIELRHADDAGRRYGLGMLDQLRAEAHGRGVEVIDWPDLVIRGYMLDVSRDRVPTRETLERLVELLALARFNHLELYVEHTFAHPGHDVVWRDASPLTADDLRWLDGRCAASGIELAVNQNCFGHMERWLRHPGYVQRSECPDGWELLGRRRPPSLLAPTAENAAFAVELVRAQLAAVSSARVNIGCDEPFELGKGASMRDVEERGREQVYFDHLLRIAEPLLASGCEVLFWADVLRSHPALVSRLPARMTPIAWLYEARRAPGDRIEIPDATRRALADAGIDLAAADEGGFASLLHPLVESGVPFWVAPGTSSWNSLVGRIDNARANILDAVVEGRRLGATGLLLTDWGDNGHLQPPVVSVPPIVYAGAVGWCVEANADLDLARVVDRVALGDDAGVLGGVLDRVGRLWRETGQQAMNASPLQSALCPSQLHFVTGEPDAAMVAAVLDTLDDALASLAAARPSATDGAVTVREVALAIRLARHGAWRLLRRAGGDPPDTSALRADITELIDEHDACWHARSRPGGFVDSVAHLKATLADYA